MNEDRELGTFHNMPVRLENGEVVVTEPDGHEDRTKPRSWEFNGHFEGWLRRRGVVFLNEVVSG